eukprot:3701113-Ditylum_brightwellii.AAC.1
MTIFHNTKETVACIGYLTKINPAHLYGVYCQEQLKKALVVVVVEVETKDNTYFPNYGTTMETVNFE